MPEEETYEEYIEEKIYQPTDKIELTKEQYEQITEDLEIAQMQLQEANDTLNGGITARNMANFRNTYVINESDSLDATYPMYVYFHVLDETVKIVSVKVSYWIHKYRAYSTAASSGGAVSSASGGGETPTSSSGGGETPTSSSGGAVSSASGGGETPTTAQTGHTAYVLNPSSYTSVTNVGSESASGALYTTATISVATGVHTHTVTIAAHTHTGGLHTHTVTTTNHTHTVTIAAHTHTGGAHTHGITYGIYEESNTPTITFSVSQDGGVGYGREYGKVAIDRELVDITDSITTTGSKIIKFESTTRTRLTVQVEVKLDIKVR